jgi:hypothetical protein
MSLSNKPIGQATVMMNPQVAEADMKLERIRWKRTKGRQQLLLDKIYDAVTEEFSRDAMASLATVLAHLCIVADVAKPKARAAKLSYVNVAKPALRNSAAT